MVRTRDIGKWAGLWMRVDRPGPEVSAFYNSQDKPIKGTTGWQERSVVLDVASDASIISFGVIGAGKGTVLIDDLKIEVVGRDVPTSSMFRIDGESLAYTYMSLALQAAPRQPV